ncbi:MAG: archease [candidate division Zixibacteria bacterium]
MQYRFVDHTADLIVQVDGDSLSEAFAGAAEALMAVITDHGSIVPVDEINFEIESVDLEGLLVGFLSHLILVHESESVVLSGFRVEFEDDSHLKATAGCEPFDEQRHGEGSQVKGVSYHMMQIEQDDENNSCRLQVLFDL